MIKKIEKDVDEPVGAPKITPELLKTTYEALEISGSLYFSEEGVYVPTERGWKLLMEVKPSKEEIKAYGSEEIKSTNKNVLTITKGSKVFDDSVIAIKSNKSCPDLNDEIKKALKEGKKVEITIEVNGITDKIIGFGSPALKIKDKNNLEIRKDDIINERTICILANKAANDLQEKLKKELKNSKNEIKIIIEVY